MRPWPSIGSTNLPWPRRAPGGRMGHKDIELAAHDLLQYLGK
ncbi:MAG TPA: hypothetical protein VF926_10210 [Mycobacterium sp.]